MPASFSCPHCGKRFSFKPEMVGKRVRCSGCKEPFTVEMDEDLMPAAPVPRVAVPAAAPVPPRAVSRPTVRAGGFPPPRSRAASNDSSGTSGGMFKIGVMMIVVGVLGLVLPFIGLQIKALNKLPDPAAGAVGCMIFGGVLCGLGTTLARLANGSCAS